LTALRLWTSEESATTIDGSVVLDSCHQCGRSITPITEPDLEIEGSPRTPDSYLGLLVESHERLKTADSYLCLLIEAHEEHAVTSLDIDLAEGSSESLPCTGFYPLPPSPCLNPIVPVDEGHSFSELDAELLLPASERNVTVYEGHPFSELEPKSPPKSEDIVPVDEGQSSFELDRLDP